MKASTICGSDIRCIYHEHLGKGPEGYQGVIAGHEPCRPDRGDRPRLPAFQRRRPRDRLSHLRLRRLQRLPPRLHDLLHQRTLPPRLRLAARWRHGRLPAGRREGPDRTCPMSFPTPMARRWPAASARSTRASEKSASAATTPCSSPAWGRWAWPPRRCAASWARSASSASTSCRSAWNWRSTWASATTCCACGPDNVAEVRALTGGRGVERAIDCSANDAARATAIRATRKWGKIVFLGEGGRSSSILRPISFTTRRPSTAPGSLPPG